MNYTVGQSYFGYKLKEQTDVVELNSVARVFKHEKSGARVLLLSNDDNNKVFSITFRTPPTDDTGLPHILEHSVLCGSKNFPAKDPFIELAKGSLNTFLNAMTFSDKTMYPVASCNEKDFQNLMHVYMDAVFYPNIYERPQILKQEGWHYDLNSLDEEIKYKGVVYNEMKGAFSSPEQILFRKIQSSLFPDTPYAHESGGDPDYITDLTQDEFLGFHKKYYHPSNSYIYLYGDFDIEEKLRWMDKEYLSNFEKIEIDSEIPFQKPFDSVKEVTEYYSISNNESEQNNTYLSYNYVVGNTLDNELYYAFEILEYILLEAPGAPLKKALIDAGIGKDVFGSYDNNILQPTFSIVAKNANEEQKDEFVKIIHNTLQKLISKGIEKKKIEAAINYHEFKIREADYGRYPKGIIYAMKQLTSWLYDDTKPLTHLQYNHTYEKIKEALHSDYFEKMIEKYLLNNNHATILMVKPKKGLNIQKDKETEEKLNAYKATLSKEELEKLVSETNELLKYQEEPSLKEDIEKIPLLNREDIKKESEPLSIEKLDTHNIRILLHPVFTNGIGYLNLLFDTKRVPEDMIQYIGLLTNVLGYVDTENYDYSELSSEININTGGIGAGINLFSLNDDSKTFLPKFEVKAKVFYDKIPIMFDLISEIIRRSKFDDYKRLYEIIAEVKSRLQMQLNSSGHAAAANRAQSYFSPVAYYKELTSGTSFYKFIEDIEANFEDKKVEISNKLIELVKYIFRRENLLISFTSEKQAYGILQSEIENFIEELYTDRIEDGQFNYESKKLNEGFMTSGKVQYVAKAGNFIEEGYNYSGTLKVLQTVLSLEYLWNNVRVKGGAYGCMCGFTRSGNAYFTSYRDPNLKETLETYDKVYDYISTFSAEERDVTKYIIGTISNIDIPLTPVSRGERSLAAYLTNVSYEDIQSERDEILNTTSDDVRRQAELIKSILKQDNICVVGNEGKLEANKELFGDLVHLFK